MCFNLETHSAYQSFQAFKSCIAHIHNVKTLNHTADLKKKFIYVSLKQNNITAILSPKFQSGTITLCQTKLRIQIYTKWFYCMICKQKPQKPDWYRRWHIKKRPLQWRQIFCSAWGLFFKVQFALFLTVIQKGKCNLALASQTGRWTWYLFTVTWNCRAISCDLLTGVTLRGLFVHFCRVRVHRGSCHDEAEKPKSFVQEKFTETPSCIALEKIQNITTQHRVNHCSQYRKTGNRRGSLKTCSD